MSGVKKEKIKKIVTYVINAIAGLLCVIILTLAIFAITSKGKGYVNYFGYAYFPVETDSMRYNNADGKYDIKDGSGNLVNDPKYSFNEGEIIQTKVLSDKEKTQLKVGDVITFWDQYQGQKFINTHRIVTVIAVSENDIVVKTKGDNAPDEDFTERGGTDIIGIYTGNASTVGGKFFMFLSSKTGFLVMCVIPSVAIMLYCLVLLVLSLMGISKEKAMEEGQKIKADFEAEKEKMKLELLEQMRLEKEKEKTGDEKQKK